MINWSEPALNDVQRIVLYLKESDPELARETAQKIFDAGESLTNFPARARTGCTINTRKLLAPKTPYINEFFKLRIIGIHETKFALTG
ncbi:type II toxin-antitoxin system RelE/ParE family toxin [Marinifilum sp. JC120]|nr:type II toxin-antitoxin system RelE/ParE family toxin [Marinifilum sp. JC120]